MGTEGNFRHIFLSFISLTALLNIWTWLTCPLSWTPCRYEARNDWSGRVELATHANCPAHVLRMVASFKGVSATPNGFVWTCSRPSIYPSWPISMLMVLGHCRISIPVYRIVKVRKWLKGSLFLKSSRTLFIRLFPPPKRSSTWIPQIPSNSPDLLRSVNKQGSSLDCWRPVSFISLHKRRYQALGASAKPYAAFSRRIKSWDDKLIHSWTSTGGLKKISRHDASPDRNAVLISAPHSVQRWAAHTDKTRLLVSFLKVGESVATRPNSGSCQPTKTNLAFGVLVLTSGSDDFFHTNTHLALIILSGDMLRDLHKDTTLLSIHDCHSFFMACRNNSLSDSFSLRKDTSTLRCLALGVFTWKHSSNTPHRKSSLSATSSG